ncbi:MAG: hypothetical protein HY556_04870 [Euryarchaeota archaeon]|nr:hypothetical protein [Euryarchaeota archaeon]
MTLVIGVGQAGSNLAAEMTRVTNAKDFLSVYLVNSTTRDLVTVRDVPRSRWIGVSDTEGLVSLAKGEDAVESKLIKGLGKDPRRGFTTLTSVFDKVVNYVETLGIKDERFAVITFSGGGGTGAGVAPVLARAIREVTEGKCRVIGVLILPAMTRGDVSDDGSLGEAWNAWYSFERSLDIFDGIILVDNNRLSHMGDVERGFPRFNKYVAHCLTDMILGNLTELVLPGEDELIIQQSDVQDLATALSVGDRGERKPGVAAIGRAVQLLRGPMGYIAPILPPKQPDLVSLSFLAKERMTFEDAETIDCEKAYVLVRAPLSILGRAGTGQDVSEVLSLAAKSSARGDVIYGTALTRRPLASVTLGLTFLPSEIPRLKELETAASEYERRSGGKAPD